MKNINTNELKYNFVLRLILSSLLETIAVANEYKVTKQTHKLKILQTVLMISRFSFITPDTYARSLAVMVAPAVVYIEIGCAILVTCTCAPSL